MLFTKKSILLVVFFYITLLQHSSSAEEINCKKCHKEVYDKILRYTIPHSNIVENNCKGCHITGNEVLMNAKGDKYKLESSQYNPYGKVEENQKGHSGQEDTRHGRQGLKNQYKAGIDSCKSCHSLGPASHPVGVTISKDTKIPENLPTGEGKIVTCATCHTPHGGNLENLARLNFQRDICVLCHTKML